MGTTTAASIEENVRKIRRGIVVGVGSVSGPAAESTRTNLFSQPGIRMDVGF